MNAETSGEPKVPAGVAPVYRLRGFGDLSLHGHDGKDFTPRSRKTRALLAFVVLNGGAPVTRERLAALFWGDRGEEQARASLRQALYELKPLSSGPGPLLTVTREHVTVNPQAIAVDLEMAEAFARASEVTALTEVLPRNQQALLGNLDDVTADFDDWLRAERSRRSERLITLSVAAGQAALDRGEVEPVRALVAALEVFDPLSEPVVRLGIQADLSSGDPTQAHRRYRRFEERLQRELGTRPSSETRALLPREGAARTQNVAAVQPQSSYDGAVGSRTNVHLSAVPSGATDAGSQFGGVASGAANEELPPGRGWARAPRKLAGALIVLLLLAGVAVAWFARGPVSGGSEAHEHFVRAEALMRNRHEPDLSRARGLLLDAVGIDPDYAPAWASLSIVTTLLSDKPETYGTIPRAQARHQALEYANKAMQLEPQLAAAHAALGLVSTSDVRSIPHYQRAIALDPKRGEYHRWLGQAYADSGRADDALVEYHKALDLEPRWTAGAKLLIGELDYIGREAEIDAVVQKFNAATTDAYDRLHVQFAVAETRGDLQQAVALGRDLMRQKPDDSQIAFSLACTLAALGDRDSALRSTTEDQILLRAVISHDVQQIETIARESPGIFWHEELAAVRPSELLVANGKGRLVLQLFDSRYSSITHFLEEDPWSFIAPSAALIIALREAGRQPEADELNLRALDRIEWEARHGIPRRALAFERAQQRALAGDHAGALADLEYLLQTRWIFLLNPPYVPLTDLVAFRTLRTDPRLIAIQQQLAARVQSARAKLDPV